MSSSAWWRTKVRRSARKPGPNGKEAVMQDPIEVQDPIEDIAHDVVRLLFKLWRNRRNAAP